MDTQIEISDDDDSFSGPGCSKTAGNFFKDDVVAISSDEEFNNISNDIPALSDDEELPEVHLQRKAAIKSLFGSKNNKNDSKKVESKKAPIRALFPQKQNVNVPVAKPAKIRQPIEAPKQVFKRMIEGVNVTLPVNPYGSQVALMSKIITAIKKSENCILESPTGSGKTLALLCGALAWQQHEQTRIGQVQVQQYFTQYPELKQEGVAEYIGSPVHQKTDVTPEKLFSKNSFGEKSIYYKPEQDGASSTTKRQEKTPYKDESDEESSCNQVTIHKRPRLTSTECIDDSKKSIPHTPEKTTDVVIPNTPESVRNLYNLVEKLRIRTSMFVDCSLPTIYYGARTHTQLKQVIKEFKRTSYCGQVKMTLLSSRDKSCIKDFDRNLWTSRNDMCRACIKPLRKSERSENKENSNCKFYDNRVAMNHGCMPAAFDLEDLVEIGREREACPYYGARAMAKTSHIVFCPYNYLIDPSIRNSMSIELTGAVVIIDEAHNIEGICRDVASVNITRTQIQNAIKELEYVAEYRFHNPEVESYVESLLKTLKNWDDWFANQIPLINQQPVNNNEAVYKWQTEHFVGTLNNHNIGYKQYNEFKHNSENFCRRLREDPRTLMGATQATGTLLESMDMVLGFLFRGECKYMDDFKPALIRHITGKTNSLSSNTSWRASQFNEDKKDWISKDSLSLSLLCMNPGIVMEGLHKCRSLALSSGTLTPLLSLHSELATVFRHQVSPSHVIPQDRVWIGSLIGASGNRQKFTSAASDNPAARAFLGAALLRVCELAPHGVLCFLPSYSLLDKLVRDWRETGVWEKMNRIKNVFCEKRNDKDHEEIMNDFYQTVGTEKGALLFAVYRGKVSEGMDFKDYQARAVVCVGVPYPNTYDTAVSAKMEYNNKHLKERSLLTGSEWLRVQAYRALNQAVGRCVRHRGDWGAVLLVDARYQQEYFTEHLSKWVKGFLGNNHHTYESLESSPNGLAAFMQRMKIMQQEETM
ncbi:Fanconi anemia group J protein homolog isoform X1 [Helicoverpa armigera]|uniref:Fanconi anemia group J protein homolog isoform X1 n=1 Tax=Helicoverpa armigera TaxID=29058 RepID=UPI003082DA8F